MTREAAERRLSEIQDEIKRLRDEEQSVRNLIAELTVNEGTGRLLKSISRVSENSAMTVRLESSTKTTPLMDRFHSSDKQFLVFQYVFHAYDEQRNRSYAVSLVTTKAAPNIEAKDDGLTMTDLKKNARRYLNFNTYEKGDRMYSLKEEIMIAISKVSNSNKTVAFEHPVRLGGQTYANQTGYGSEFNGYDQVYQGTLYGETTDFYIIGIIVI